MRDRLAVCMALPLLLAACERAPANPADVAPDAAASDDPGNWRGFGRTEGEQHFSPLTEISASNVSRLGLAWSFDLEAANSVTAPVAVDGVLYMATGYSVMRALDAVTGRELWRYDPEVPQAAGLRLRQGWGSRGLAYLDGRLFTGTQDGRLIAVDAKSGKPLWSVQTLEPGDIRFISGAPRAFDGKVIIGHGGSDSGPTRGYVTCYDAATGRQLWRFWLVPGDPAKGFENAAMAMAAKTWTGEWWKLGGGGGAWNAFAYDPELKLVFIGTGNGAPWNQKIRSPGGGDNLFLSSIVALNAETGEYVWHYQTNPGETWDYNATMDIELATLMIDGAPRKVLMQAPKNGFFYVLDRKTGKLLSAEPFAKITWASRIDLKTGRPVEAPNARYTKGSFELWPGATGAHSWLPMAFSPQTGLVYIPASDRPMIINDEGVDLKGWKWPGHNIVDGGTRGDFSPKLPGGSTSFLVAWNPVTQKPAWKVPTPGFWGGGVMTTGGRLVFQGQIDHKFNAYDAANGALRWTFDAGAPVLAPPITYTAQGHQYVTVLTGWGTSGAVFGSEIEKYRIGFNQSRRVLTFRLDSKTALPPSPPWQPVTPPDDPTFRPDRAKAERGGMVVAQYCVNCHGMNLIAAGHAPDLRGSAVPLSPEAFRSIVKGGGLVASGMPKFDDISDADVEAARQHIRAVQDDMRRGRGAAKGKATAP